MISAAPAIAQEAMSASIVSVLGCPAVVSTTDVCSTCVAAACVVPATITAGCGDCPESPPTVYRSFPCEEGCNNIGCRTVYSVVTATGSVCPAAPTPTPSQDPDNPADGDDPTEPATLATTASTAGAARLMPCRLW
ncbi:uncharacterized protein P884DRAFT_199726 [Thermothelomyces heterothallicus CBS 202.75]|uniref:uncharacterized protein n=1 Tax=Thermothelomyces heterothallicus CBS 202.75 TaxID=1149848 RepID=UPI003743281E